MARVAARDVSVGREELLRFVRPRHHGILVTTRGDGSPQLSPVTMGIDVEGRIVVSTYPERAKVRNAREAMVHQGKVLLRLAIERWGPISRGGFPSRLVENG